MPVEYPPGHAWHYAVFIPAPSPSHARMTHQNPYLTLPDDYVDTPDWSLGMVLEIKEVLCVKCRLPYGQAVYEPACAADSNPDYLRGGKRDRAWRRSAPPGQSAAEVAARRRLEDPALMQGSRIASF
ncbi:hypothetical protein ACQP10_37880 (plasmid) [Streptosporangium sandarakinum]|uniref:hypothetical protein n=1 Tax=Streptosporangium sandarakinum TaxID=1260955 RepID=UPI003D91E0F7